MYINFTDAPVAPLAVLLPLHLQLLQVFCLHIIHAEKQCQKSPGPQMTGLLYTCRTNVPHVNPIIQTCKTSIHV